MKKIIFSVLTTLALVGVKPLQAQTAYVNYAEALQKSLYFYDAEKSGPGIAGGRLQWRGNSEVEDKKIPLTTTSTNLSAAFIQQYRAVLDPDGDGTVDVSGGYHDAGDHVKFGLPQTYAASTLGWGVYEFKDAFVQTGEYAHVMELLRWFSDYFLRSTFRDASGKVVAFCYQVGEGSVDHNYWGPPELQEISKFPRPAYFATAQTPASDQAAGAAAALAVMALNTAGSDAAYAARCLDAAKALYSFAVANRGLGYSGGFYGSSFDEDELSWAAIWLHIATNQASYLNDIISTDATGRYTGWLKRIIATTANSWQNIWVHSWDTVWGGMFAKLAPITNNPFHWYVFRWNLEYWSGIPHENPSDVTFVAKSRANYAVLNTWGSARYNTAAQLQALVYRKYKGDARFADWAKGQMEYIMGKNPLNRSYIVGYSTNYAKHPHHRAAHGSKTNSAEDPKEHRHTLWGALVGGPDINDVHLDSTSNYVYNEVAVDYNAAFVGALAGHFLYYGAGQRPLTNFPPLEPRVDEFYAEAKLEQENNERTQVSIYIHNESVHPPRFNQTMKARYFFNISEMMAFGQTINDVKFEVYYDQSKMGYGQPVTARGPYPWDVANGVYYMEFDWSGYNIYGDRAYQFGLIAKQDASYQAHWNPTNDFSRRGITGQKATTPYIPVYLNGQLYFGQEPPKGNNLLAQITATPTGGQAPLTVRLDGSASVTGGQTVTYTWDFGDGTTGTGAVVNHTYTVARTYTAKLTIASGANTSTAQVPIEVLPAGGGSVCTFGTPLAAALPSITNKTYTKVYKLGVSSANFSNVTQVTVNWDLQNRGLYQFSIQTNNGQPAWFTNLLQVVTHRFGEPRPDVTIAGSGFAGLDGSYYAAKDGDNFVLVAKNGLYAYYFSNSVTPPSCPTAARLLAGISGSEPVLYPMPATDGFVLHASGEAIRQVEVFDALGKRLHVLTPKASSQTLSFGRTWAAGVYFVRITSDKGVKTLKAVKE